MLNLLNSDKKKGATLVIEAEMERGEEKKDSSKMESILSQAFDALGSGEKQKFVKAIKAAIEISKYEMEDED